MGINEINKTMQAYEFSTVIHDGIIRVPKQFYNEKTSLVRVILLADSMEKSVNLHKNKFTAMQLKTKGFIFNREEAHER